MIIARIDDARAFRDFLDAQLAAGGASRSLDEILDLWHVENAPEAEREETLRAIREGLDDMDAGRTRPFEEFDREFRERNGLPQRS
jgi:hypothetical protein